MAVASKSPQDLARAFAALFAGLERAHGRYVVPREAKANAKGKVEGKAWTSRQSLTLEDWTAHLTGDPVTVNNGDDTITGTLGLGVVPIRDDATVVFGAIDIDVYPLDLKDLASEVRALQLPLVLCRTKSGGAHLYLFMNEPTPAEAVRDRLMEFAVLLGHPGVEVFPKQTRLASDNDDGSWINVPYAGGDRSVRYALVNDAALTTEEFLEHARARAISAEDLAAFVPTIPEASIDDQDMLAGGPPCLTVLARRGFVESYRNNSLFNIGVYLKKRYGDEEYAEHLDAYNQRYMSPPLGHGEVAVIVKSLRKKTYSYRCKDQPIVAVCNRQLCLKCEHGVGGGRDDPGVVLGELIKIETTPPTWIWDVDGARIELATPQLMDQRMFHAAVIETLNKWPHLVKPPTWQALVRERLQRAEVVPVPEDATREGQLWVHLTKFCTSRVVGRSIDELLLGKPFTDEKAQRTYFCSSDFLQYLQQHRISGVNEKDLYKWLRKRGVEHHFNVIKGKGLNYWSVTAFQAQTEEHTVPRAPVQGAM